MTHATRTELQDHVYGFRLSDHVAACPDCRSKADELAAERGSLRDAFREAPVTAPPELFARLGASRPRFTAPALAAAALLLAVLGGLLFAPPTPETAAPIAAASLSQDAEINRLITQLKGSSEIRRGIAAAALRKYGGVAVDPLVKAQADPALIEECRGFTLEDQAFFKKAQEPKITVGFDKIPLTDAVGFLSHLSTLPVHISQVDNPESILVTLKLQKASLIEALERIKADTKIPWGRSSGRTWSSMLVNPAPYTPVLFLGVETPAPPSAAPLRLLPRRPWAAALPRNPSSDWPQERLLEALKTLRAAADPALWDFLDSTDPVLRRAAESELRSLYGAPAAAPVSALSRILDETRSDLSFEDTELAAILSHLSKTSGVSIVVDPRIEIPKAAVTFKVKDLALKNTLKLLLSQFSLDFVPLNEAVLVTRADLSPRRIRTEAPFWMSPEDAGTAETAIDDLLSADAARQEKARARLKEIGAPALDWLSYAWIHMEGALRLRASDELRSHAEDLGIWMIDGPRSPDPSILKRRVTIDGEGRTLEAVMKAEKIPLTLKVRLDQPLMFSVRNLELGELLMSLTRPLGLNVTVQGDTVLVDTAARIRAAIGEK